MKDLVNALKNQGAYAILNDIAKQGYCRRTKDNERAKTVPILVDNGIVESVAPTESMLRFLRFVSEQSKQDFIAKNYFLTITEKGRLVFELLKWQKESVKAERERAAQENYNTRKNIAEKLLKIVGMELGEFTDYEED